MGRHRWRIVSSLALLLMLSFFINFLGNPSVSADDSLKDRNLSLIPPYGPNSPVGQFNGSGDALSVFATYNKTENTKVEANDTDDFSIETISDWDTTFNISISDILADDLHLDIETNDTVINGGLGLTRAMSFRITNSCRVSSLMLMLQANIGGFGSNPDVFVFVFNATNSGGKPVPNSTMAGYSVGIDLTDTNPHWFPVTFPAGSILEPSDTYQNYFFVVASNVLTGDANWNYRNDAETGDGGFAYRHTGVNWLEVANIDHFLNVSLTPLTNSPAPSGVNMFINGTRVVDSGVNSGWWNGSIQTAGSSTFFDATSSWPIVFNFTYNAVFSYIFPTSTYFNATEGSLVNWNISASISYPNIGANLNSRTLNFSIPERWTITAVYNHTDPAIYQAGTGWVFVDEPGGAGNGTLWRVMATDDNYLQNVLLYRDQQNVNELEVNITDSLEVNASLQPYYTDGHGNLTIYDVGGTSLYEWCVNTDAYWLNFSAFTPSDYVISNEKLTCEVIWSNGLHVGVNSSFVWLVFPTELLPEQTVYVAYADDSVILRVYYNDTFNSSPIDGADVNVTVDGTTYIMTPQVGGWYQYTWDSTLKIRGNYPVSFWANKTGYSQTITTALIQLNSRTQLTYLLSSPSVYYNNSVELRANYTRLTGGSGGIWPATVNVSIAAQTFNLDDWGNGTYTILLNGTDLDLGLHTFTIRAQSPLHEGQQVSDNLNVVEEPTQIIGDSTLNVWGGNDFNVTLTYQTQLNVPLSGATINCQRNGSVFTDFNYWEIAPGEYKVNFTFWVQTNTTYDLDFTISAHGYVSQNWLCQVDVSVIPSTLTVISQSSDPIILGDTILITLSFNATDGTPLTGAVVNHNWTATVPTITENNGVYEIQIPTEDADPGTWHIWIRMELINYEAKELTFRYGLKFRVQIEIIFDGQPVEGGLLRIGALLTFQNGTQVQPVQGGLVSFSIVLSFPDDYILFSGNTQISTDLDGMGWFNYTIDMVPLLDWFTRPRMPLILNVQVDFFGNDCFLEAAATPQLLHIAKSVLNLFLVDVLPWLVVILIILLVVIFAWRRRRAGQVAKQKELETVGSSWAHRMMGLMDLRVLFVMYAATGLPIFTYSFTGGELPSTLLSGFISAVNSFYSELSGTLDRESQLRDIHYKDLHLSLREGKHVISVLILDASPSEEITESLAAFTQEFEGTFMTELAGFDGRIDIFDPASEIVEKSFHSELLIAYECKNTPPRGFSRKVFDLALKLANDQGQVFLPQLFVGSIEKFGVKKKYDIANALELLCNTGCLVPHKFPINTDTSQTGEERAAT